MSAGRQVGTAKKVIGASAEGKRIEPVPELSNLESWRSRAATETDTLKGESISKTKKR